MITPKAKSSKNQSVRLSNKATQMPSIVVEGITSHLKKLRNMLRVNLQITYLYFKFTQYNTMIFITNEKDYNNLLQYMKNQYDTEISGDKTYFYTYTPTQEKHMDL